MFGNKKSESADMTKTQSKAGAEDGKSEASPQGTAASAKPKKKGKGKKKKIIIAVAAMVVIAIAVKVFAGNGEVLMPVTEGTAQTMDIQQIISIKGTIEGNDRAEITSGENREIATISVKEGDTVTQGQVLARLKPSDDDNDNSEIYQRQEARNNLESAKFDYDTTKQLYSEGAVSKQDLLKAETAYKNAQNALANANDTKKKTEDNEITSPISGIVTRVNAKVGFTANQMENGTALFVVEDLSSLKMEVKVSEYDISNISMGQDVSITAEVLGNETVNGTVSHIAPTGELKDNSGKEMVIPVKIDIISEAQNLIAGVTAKANILVAEKKNVVGISLDVLQTDPATGETFVYTLSKENVVSKTVITTGLESDFYIEVAAGNLKDGDRVILNPPAGLAEGQSVAPQGAGDGSSAAE